MMDIQRWLDETASPGDICPASASWSNPFDNMDKPKPVVRGTRAAKRTESDSSLLVPQSRSRRAPPRQPKFFKDKHPNVSVSSKASRSSRGHSTRSESSSQRYARKPRRKTRPERYEPKLTRERGKHVHQSRTDESKKMGRKSKRKKVDKSGNGVTQSFQTKNVSRDRLTLKPREQLGIFNKGKTSTMVRGRGLPDLVFSEMKFLQKEKDKPEPVPEPDIAQKKRKRDHKDSKEGEISAFFTSVRPVLAEQDNNAQINHIRANVDRNAEAGCREQQRSPKPSGVVPTIELPGEGSYSGFGSKKPRHESTDYVSWSDSVQSPRKISQHTEHVPIAEKKKYKSLKQHGGISKSGSEIAGPKYPVLPSVSRHRASESMELFKVSPEGPSHQRICRSHSYPQQSSSPQKVNPAISFDSPSPIPAVVPARVSVERQSYRDETNSLPTKSDKNASTHTKNNSGGQRNVPVAGTNDACVKLHLSSDLGEIIQQCNRIFDGRHLAIIPPRRHPTFPNVTQNNSEASRHTHLDMNCISRRVPTVHFADIDKSSPTIPNFLGHSIYEEQAQRQRWPVLIRFDGDRALENINLVQQEYEAHPQSILPTAPGRDGYFEEPVAFDEWDDDAGEQDTFEGSVHDMRSEKGIVAARFWRPNRLY
ncbi:hypothetical protein GQ44DRAFT_5113 [Phaeosphaeriaceae sp. PMI808]|nr:hypothetical protein GQ44DRAFT_5113 [Phaeosphaeriaceae sp. PMI808]